MLFFYLFLLVRCSTAVHQHQSQEIDERADVTAVPRSLSAPLRSLESHASLPCTGCLISPRWWSSRGWVTAARQTASAWPSSTTAVAIRDRKRSSTSAGRLVDFSHEAKPVRYVPLSGRPHWHLALWQSLAMRKKRKKAVQQEAL